MKKLNSLRGRRKTDIDTKKYDELVNSQYDKSIRMGNQRTQYLEKMYNNLLDVTANIVKNMAKTNNETFQ